MCEIPSTKGKAFGRGNLLIRMLEALSYSVGWFLMVCLYLLECLNIGRRPCLGSALESARACSYLWVGATFCATFIEDGIGAGFAAATLGLCLFTTLGLQRVSRPEATRQAGIDGIGIAPLVKN
jgi:hypothetical protein